MSVIFSLAYIQSRPIRVAALAECRPSYGNREPRDRYYHFYARLPPQIPPPNGRPSAGLRRLRRRKAQGRRPCAESRGSPGDPRGGSPLGTPRDPGGTPRDPGFFRGEKSGISLLFFISKAGIFPRRKIRVFDMKNKAENRDFWAPCQPLGGRGWPQNPGFWPKIGDFGPKSAQKSVMHPLHDRFSGGGSKIGPPRKSLRANPCTGETPKNLVLRRGRAGGPGGPGGAPGGPGGPKSGILGAWGPGGAWGPQGGPQGGSQGKRPKMGDFRLFACGTYPLGVLLLLGPGAHNVVCHPSGSPG